MDEASLVSKESIVVLFKGGRLPAWHGLTSEEQRAYSKAHVELMLSVSREHGMSRLEGFRLITPHERWERFWLIEFPDLLGAEAWIDAEIAPPYGSYGYHDYFVARPWRPDYLATWSTGTPAPSRTFSADPHHTPALEVDRDSIVVLLFGRWLPEADGVSPLDRGDPEHIELVQSVARDHGLIRLEAFSVIGPQNGWRRAWVIEFPTLEGAEAWIDAETRPPRARFSNQDFHLARKWAPEYFASWALR